jgi:apolipoprotein N-acyltransferase
MKKNTLLAIFSGLLLWIAWPPSTHTSILLLFGLVPMLVAMENIIQSDTPKKGRKIFRITFLGFFIWNTLCIYWVYNALKMIGSVVAAPVSLIPYSLGPLLMATACWLYYRTRLFTTRNYSLALLVCFWIGYEYLHQTWDLKFPWMTLGNGFAVSHKLVQWYEYTGIYGGTIWIWLCNILAFLLYIGLREQPNRTTRIRLVTGLVLAILLPISLSLCRYYTYTEPVNPSNVVVVQPNVDPYEKEGSIPVSKQISSLVHLSDSIGQVNTEFFIWPETAIADLRGINEDGIRTHPYFQQAQSFLHKYPNATLISGFETFKIYSSPLTPTASLLQGNEYYDRFNAAVSIENSAEVHFYHKSKLVPGAEALPFGNALSFLKPVFAHLGGATGGYGTQAQPGVLYSQGGIGVGPVICYESIWGEWIAGSVRNGAQLIAIITNDGWWENTSGKDQHLDYAKLRAIETRRWVCRSANTGISAFIDERGDIVQHTGWWVKTAIKQNINLNTELTFYVQHGDYLPKTAGMIALLGIGFIGYKRIKDKPKKAV